MPGIGFDPDAVRSLSRMTETAKSFRAVVKATGDDDEVAEAREVYAGAMRALCWGLAEQKGYPPASILEDYERVACARMQKARYDVRHPATGQYVPKPRPIALSRWKHGGNVHPAVATLPHEDDLTKSSDDPLLGRVRAEFLRLAFLDRNSVRIW